MTRLSKNNNKVSTLEAIPNDLLTEILSRVAASSIVDIHNVKLSCKHLNEVAEDGHVYKHTNLDIFPVVWKPIITEKEHEFFNKCRKMDNPEMLYRDALIDYFNRRKSKVVRKKLTKALKLGHEGAMYMMSIVLLFSSRDELRRKGVKLMSKIMKKTRKLRLCREKLYEELMKMWVKNPVLKGQPKYCKEQHQKKVGWSNEGDDVNDCEACAADNEVRVISSTYNFV